VPAADVLPRDTELVGDLGLRAAGGEQLAGLETDTFRGLAVTQTAGVAAVGGWSHAAGTTPVMSSEGANLFLAASLKPRQLSSALPSKAATTEGRIWTERFTPSLCQLRIGPTSTKAG
jgi:hypothetical protein